MTVLAAKADFLDLEYASKGDTATAKYNVYGTLVDTVAHAALISACRQP